MIIVDVLTIIAFCLIVMPWVLTSFGGVLAQKERERERERNRERKKERVSNIFFRGICACIWHLTDPMKIPQPTG